MMADTSYRHATCIGVHYEFSIAAWLSQCYSLYQCYLDAVKGLLLLPPPTEMRCLYQGLREGGYQIGMPWNEIAIEVGETQEALHLCFVSRDAPITELGYCLWVWFDSFSSYHSSAILDFALHEVTL